jgi:tetratricopeptide (TPR) repeat protein
MIYNERPQERERGVMVDESDDSQKVVRTGPELLESSVTTPAGISQDEPAPARELGPGVVLSDRYQLEAALGQGGSGSVHRAWDRVLGEPIAIKILRPDRARERSWIMRLAREVKVARAIRHPNVCRVFELGHADGHWFVTMELGTGGTLRALLHEGGSAQRPLAERLEDARAICAGLAAIHAVGIVHRDVTPQNLLRMGDGRLVISDFGLAIELTATTTLHGGTPNYMPPETMLGRRADQRSDVWQLGVILHELFFGRRPAFRDIEDKTTMEWPVPPEATPVEEELARLCADCLSTIPAARPQTALAVAGRLAAAEVARPRSALRRSWLRARNGLQRHRRLVWAAAIAAACGGSVRAVQIADRPRLCRAAGDKLAGVWDPDIKREVRASFDRSGRSYAAGTFASVDRLLGDYLAQWSGMYTEACEATNVRGEQSAEVLDLRMACLGDRLGGVKALTRILAHADGQVVDNAVGAAGALGTLELCADARLLRNLLPLPDDPAARQEVARIRAGIADVKALDDAGDERGAAASLQAQVASARRVGYAPALVEALVLTGKLEAESGGIGAASQAFKEAVWQAEASRDDELKAEAATFLVATSGRSERFEEAADWAREADAILARIGGHERVRSWLEQHLALTLLLQGRYAEGLVHDRRALAIKEQSGAGLGEIGRSLNNLAITLTDLGQYEEALRDFDLAIHDLGEQLGDEHPLVATFISNEGETLDRVGRHAAARAAYQKALQIEERGYGPESTNVAYPLTGLGKSFLADHRPSEARAPLERAARIRQASETDAALVAETSFALARALRGANVERARAERLATEAEQAYARIPSAAAKAKEIASWLAEGPPAAPSAR